MKDNNTKQTIMTLAKIFGIIIFCFLSVNILSIIIPKLIVSVMLRNILFMIGSVVVIAIGILLFFKMHRKRGIILVYILNAVILISIPVILFLTVGTMGKIIRYINYGNNRYNCSYNRSIGGWGYSNVDEAVSRIVMKNNRGIGFKKFEEQFGSVNFEKLYSVSEGNYVWTFYRYDFGSDVTSILSMEFYKENNKYYLFGNTSLMYGENDFTSSGHSDEDTIRADIAISIFGRIKDKGIIYPAWGVSENSEIANAYINGVQVDHVEEITIGDGKTYYFWVIKDIGEIEDINEIENIAVEGI